MKCKVCSYDHSEFDRLWVDRAMQGKCEELEAKLKIAIEALYKIDEISFNKGYVSIGDPGLAALMAIMKIKEVK